MTYDDIQTGHDYVLRWGSLDRRVSVREMNAETGKVLVDAINFSRWCDPKLLVCPWDAVERRQQQLPSTLLAARAAAEAAGASSAQITATATGHVQMILSPEQTRQLLSLT